MNCLVEFDYDAQEDDELSVKKGDIVKHCVHVEEGWMRGEIKGKEGVFPDNFVKILDSKPTDDDVYVDVNEQEAATKRARVLHNYTARMKDELTVGQGSVVEIIGEAEEGWYKASFEGKTGVIPSNFVEVITPSNASKSGPGQTEESTATAKDDGGNVAGPRKVVGVGFGNIFSGQQIQLKKTQLKKEPSEDNPTPPKTNVPSIPAGAPSKMHSKTEKERVRVRFAYKADNTDELDLEVGEIVTVLDKELVDEGWWKGEVRGRVGVFPDNFVEPLAPGEAPPDDKRGPPPPVPPHKPTTLGSEPPAISAKSGSQKKPTTDSGKPNGKSGDVFNLNTNHVPLSPLTTDRPKQAGKRPPSKSFSMEENEEMSPVPRAAIRHPFPSSDSHKLSNQEAKRVEIPSSKGEDMDLDKRPGNRRGGPQKSTNKNQVGSSWGDQPSQGSTVGVESAVIAELKQETAELRKQLETIKETMVPRRDYEELRTEVESVRRALTNRIHALVTEIDEEKKLRLDDHVELHRIKKLAFDIDAKALANKK